VPAFNVDGIAMIEEEHNKDHKWNQILTQRKNVGDLSSTIGKNCKDGERGVDLNRNYGVDWYLTSAENIANYECSEFYAGINAFSEKETQAMKSFLDSKKDELRFVVNMHSNGPGFMWAFNGR